MRKTDLLTKILAVVGTLLVWLPILAPIIFSALRFVQSGRFLFDYLMPAELAPVAFLGAGLLLWSALRAKAFVKQIAGLIVAAVALLLGSQGLAVVTGLASGATEMGGWEGNLVLAGVVLYDLTVVALGVCGIKLMRHLANAPQAD